MLLFYLRCQNLACVLLSSRNEFWRVLFNSLAVDKVDPVVGIFGLRPIQCLVSVHITDLVLHFSMWKLSMFVFTLFWGHAEDCDFRCWKEKKSFLLSKEFWRFGRLFPCVCCGLFGKRGMVEILVVLIGLIM